MNTTNVSPTTHSDQQLSSSQKKKSAKEERINTALRDALYMHSESQERWGKLIANGAHDNEIWHAVLREFGGGGSSSTEGGDQYSFQGGNGYAQPKFWFSCGTYLTDAKPTLAGARLLSRIFKSKNCKPRKTARSLNTKRRSAVLKRSATRLCARSAGAVTRSI